MKRIVISLILIFSVLFGLAACGKDKDNQETETVTETVAYFVDEEGVSHRVESSVDENGETKYSYTENGSVVTVKNDSVVVETTVIAVTKKTTTKSTQDANAAAESLLAELTKNLAENESKTKVTLRYEQTLPIDETSVGATSKDSNGNVIPVNPYPQKSYKEITESGRYTLKFTLKTINKATGESTTSPVTMVVDGDKAFVSATMSQDGTSLEVNYICDGNKSYFTIPAIRAYTQADSSFIDDIIPDLTESAQNDAAFVKNYNAKVDGYNYYCEEYLFNGETVRYYYLNGDINRIETNNADTTTIMQINMINANVDSKLFKIPSGYIDIAKLGEDYDFGKIGA